MTLRCIDFWQNSSSTSNKVWPSELLWNMALTIFVSDSTDGQIASLDAVLLEIFLFLFYFQYFLVYFNLNCSASRKLRSRVNIDVIFLTLVSFSVAASMHVRNSRWHPIFWNYYNYKIYLNNLQSLNKNEQFSWPDCAPPGARRDFPETQRNRESRADIARCGLENTISQTNRQFKKFLNQIHYQLSYFRIK